MELDWLPVPDETAATTRDALLALFVEFGPPLVLKSDNGSAFKGDVITLLDDWQITPLRSPPKTPRYHGSREAGIGACFVWVMVTCFVLFGILRAAGLLRVSEEDEVEGLDFSEHAATAYQLSEIRT